jgi:hypothetical protein
MSSADVAQKRNFLISMGYLDLSERELFRLTHYEALQKGLQEEWEENREAPLPFGQSSTGQ